MTGPPRQAAFGAALVLSVCLGFAPAAHGVSDADDVCSSQAAPCVVSEVISVDNGVTLDFGSRTLAIVSGGRFDLSEATATIRAGRIEASTGSSAAFKVSGSLAGGGNLTLEARRICSDDPGATCLVDGDCAAGTCSAGDGEVVLNGKVSGSGDSPANILIYAAGDITLSQAINAGGSSADSDGGTVTVESFAGSVTVEGAMDLGSGGEGTGGDVVLAAAVDLVVGADINAHGGDFGGGTVDLSAGQDLTVSADITVNSTAGAGDGGDIDLQAGRDLTLLMGSNGQTTLSSDGHKSNEDDCGDGGDLALDATGDLAIEGSVSISADGAKPDCFGGAVELSALGDLSMGGLLAADGLGKESDGGELDLLAGGDMVVSGSLRARAKGSAGGGGFIELEAGGSVFVDSAATFDASGKSGGGEVGIIADVDLSFSGQADASGGNSGIGGTIDLQAGLEAEISGTLLIEGASTGEVNGDILVDACWVTLLTGGQLTNIGEAGENSLTGRERITVDAGAEVLADTGSGINTLLYRTPLKPPVVDGTVVPAAQLVLNENLFGCPVCGNAELDYSEDCDDGDLVDGGNGCAADCSRNDVCGNGVVETIFEDCDDGNLVDGDGCDENCTATACGNGVVTAGEECDDGASNSDNEADACRSDCLQAECGDGVIDTGENCDDGNLVDGDGCEGDCSTAVTTTTVTTTTTTTTVVSSVRCGDANEDDAINATDALIVLKRAVNLVADDDCPSQRCDVNGDQSVNATDALITLKVAVNLVPESDLACSP